MYIVLLVAWCGRVASGAENKEEKWERSLMVVKENFSPSFPSLLSSIPSFPKKMQVWIACAVLFKIIYTEKILEQFNIES